MSKIQKWDTNPTAAFNDFVRSAEYSKSSRRRKPSDADPEILAPGSAEIYSFMFNKFAAWLKTRGLTMSTLDGQALYEFLDSRAEDGEREIHSRIAHRYLRLLERCYDFLEVRTNPAKSAILGVERERRSLGQDKSMAVLNPDQEARFINALPDPTGGWKRRRDRAMQLVMLMAGLKVSEAIGLQMDEIAAQSNLDGSLSLPITPVGKHQTSYEHETRMRSAGVTELLAWIAERRSMPFQGTLAFPANFRGDPLDKATVYRQVKATFSRAEITVDRSGGRTLRNTFAVQELEEISIEELTELLGLALPRSTKPYTDARSKLK
jgi:integrase/recombinase XerD